MTGFDAATPWEIASRERFLFELNRLVDPFDRDADPVHVAGSAIVLAARGPCFICASASALRIIKTRPLM